jgi:hypothetical protein
MHVIEPGTTKAGLIKKDIPKNQTTTKNKINKPTNLTRKTNKTDTKERITNKTMRT